MEMTCQIERMDDIWEFSVSGCSRRMVGVMSGTLCMQDDNVTMMSVVVHNSLFGHPLDTPICKYVEFFGFSSLIEADRLSIFCFDVF